MNWFKKFYQYFGANDIQRAINFPYFVAAVVILIIAGVYSLIH